MKWFIVFILVFYQPNEKTDEIKVYNLKENSRFEITETLSEGYKDSEKQSADKINYNDLVEHTSKLLYPDFYLDF